MKKERILGTKSASPLAIDPEKQKGSRLALVTTFLVPALLVAGLLLLLVSFRGGIEARVANVASVLPVSFAFAAGMVASVNPCGVLMLPGYVFYQLQQRGSRTSPVRRALQGFLLAAVVTSGFVLVFAVVGGVVAAGGQFLVRSFPYVGLFVGLAMVGLGVWILTTDQTLSILVTSQLNVERQRSLGNAFLFGLAYAIGSLSCTLPIFLVVVSTSLASGGALAAFTQFIGYSLGMGTIIFVVTLGAALFRRAMGRWLRLIAPYIHRLTAMFAIGAGVYLIYYWIFIAGLT